MEDQMSVTALDDYTSRRVLPLPFAPFLRPMARTAIYHRHVPEPYVEDGTFSEVWDINTDPSEIISAGPFTIETFEPGERVVFQRSADYWLTDEADNPCHILTESFKFGSTRMGTKSARTRQATPSNFHC